MHHVPRGAESDFSARKLNRDSSGVMEKKKEEGILARTIIVRVALVRHVFETSGHKLSESYIDTSTTFVCVSVYMVQSVYYHI